MIAAKGCDRPPKSRKSRGLKRIVIAFEPDAFNDVATLAEKRGRSFNEQVRQLVDMALTEIDVREAM